MKKILVCLLMIICLCGCSNEVSRQMIDNSYIEKIVMDKKYTIVDVRSKEEYDEIHIKDSINIPVDEINEDINLDKDNIIFVYCKSGNRSGMAYQTLKSLGYTVYDLGGISDIDLEKIGK